MSTTIVYWGHKRIMEKKVEATIMGYIAICRVKGSGIH